MQVSLWINDNPRALPVNRLATALSWYLDPGMIEQHQLHGAVIVTGGPTRSGANTSVPSWMVDIWRELKDGGTDWTRVTRRIG